MPDTFVTDFWNKYWLFQESDLIRVVNKPLIRKFKQGMV